MKTKQASKRKRGRQLRSTGFVSQRRELNLADRQSLLEAADDLKSQGNLRLLIEDDTEETWAILMGAKALEKLANNAIIQPHEN